MHKSVASIITVILLASCASGPPRIPRDVIDRTLVGAPGEAQPGKIVAAEIAFAKAAREEGQWTAFRQFVAPGGMLHGSGGPFEAAPWLATRKDPPVAVQWSPSSIWMSCDGAIAVSRGRSRDAAGLVGSFVTVWQRQPNGEYRWIYDTGETDDPQPVEVDDGAELVVSADDIVQGYVADCPAAGAALPPQLPPAGADAARSGTATSPDRTLSWTWTHGADGARALSLDYLTDGRWERVAVQSYPARAPN